MSFEVGNRVKIIAKEDGLGHVLKNYNKRGKILKLQKRGLLSVILDDGNVISTIKASSLCNLEPELDSKLELELEPEKEPYLKTLEQLRIEMDALIKNAQNRTTWHIIQPQTLFHSQTLIELPLGISLNDFGMNKGQLRFDIEPTNTGKYIRLIIRRNK